MEITIRKIASKVKRKFIRTPEDITFSRVKKLSDSCQEYIEQNNIMPTVQILCPSNFNMETIRLAHDAFLGNALRLRGANLIPTICNQIQSEQCIFMLGLWGENSSDNIKQRNAVCQSCTNRDRKFWSLLGIKPISLDTYLSEEEKKHAQQEAKILVKQDWENQICEDGFPIGLHVQRAVLNGELQGEITSDWRVRADQLAYYHIYNVLVLKKSYQRIFSQKKIDCVLGNGGFYYHWKVPEFVAQHHEISYFRSYPIGFKYLSFNYQRNNDAFLDCSQSWQAFKKLEFDKEMDDAVNKHFASRKFFLQHSQSDSLLWDKVTQYDGLDKLVSSKPVYLALLGVIWDATTNFPSACFSNMYQWIWETIEWFRERPDLQFVIRVHPGEKITVDVAGDRGSQFELATKAQGITIPKNVFIVPYDSQIDTYELMQIADTGISYSSTSGLEFACLGKPTVVLGAAHYLDKGFTLEPQTKAEYFKLLDFHSKAKYPVNLNNEISLLARKYWFFVVYHVSMDFNAFESLQPEGLRLRRAVEDFVATLKPLSYRDLLPGVNKSLDYICDAILENRDIFSKELYPPRNLDLL